MIFHRFLNEYEYHSEASPASQPAHLQAVDQPAQPRSIASKTIQKIIAFPKSLPNEIDASRFSGPEHFFAGAPLISLITEIERRFFDVESIDLLFYAHRSLHNSRLSYLPTVMPLNVFRPP